MRRTIFSLSVVDLMVGCDFIGGGETDDDLKALYTTVRQSALVGDLKAALVMLKIASIQRAPEDSED